MPDLRSEALADAQTLQEAAERLRQQADGRAHAALVPTVLGGVEQSLHELSRGCHAAVGSLTSSPSDTRSRDPQAELAAVLQDVCAALRTAAESCGRARELMWVTMGAPDRSADAADLSRPRAVA